MEIIKLLRKKEVTPQEVLMLKGNTNYTEVHFTNGNILLLAKTLKKLEVDFFPHGFFRLNKTNMINLKYMSYAFEDYSYVIMKNKLELSVSRRRRENLKQVIRLRAV